MINKNSSFPLLQWAPGTLFPPHELTFYSPQGAPSPPRDSSVLMMILSPPLLNAPLPPPASPVHVIDAAPCEERTILFSFSPSVHGFPRHPSLIPIVSPPRSFMHQHPCLPSFSDTLFPSPPCSFPIQQRGSSLISQLPPFSPHTLFSVFISCPRSQDSHDSF